MANTERPAKQVEIRLSGKHGINVVISGPVSNLPGLEAAAVQVLGWLAERSDAR